MKKYFFIIFLLILAAMIIASCGSSAEPEAAATPTTHPGKALVSSRCTICHELNRVENASYDREGWQLTVKRMVDFGAQLSEEQAGLTVDFLAANYPKE